MVTKCYILCSNEITLREAAALLKNIPCFIDARVLPANHFEMYVECRCEDVAAVELALAYVV